jgi:hypothetical protein
MGKIGIIREVPRSVEGGYAYPPGFPSVLI